MNYHLAEINIARLRAPLHDPMIADFVAQLDTINALADVSPGFVWRLQSDGEEDATSIRAFEDEQIIVNLSVWESLEALSGYVYHSQHGKAMGDRHRWFEKLSHPSMALWWVPAGYIPTVEEGKQRLQHLQQHGSTAHAFTFRQPFAAPDLVEVKCQ
ncbi:DUF3291 domain-containing protein [Oscillatoria sp. FACHB-1407]|uniref:DUF3291 domain-containing protein n=1 Tax=Oscillatoria sp. FACHB-1407 TaxID=2692847 RepID=UPI00168998CD|nr:DUF3291 domain-containing protein [Oscillatoria sp. FACHB-1407]MBD2459582.1 DUF3291 domain-containing protein [Oscillatoria sp. FACHB-1407]